MSFFTQPAPYNLSRDPNPFSVVRTCSPIKLFLKVLQSSRDDPTLTQVFSKKFCETFQNTFFVEHLRATISDSVQFITWSLTHGV